MSNIKISVIVPVYNVEKYLHQCIDSILAQTLKDIEIICINDGSTDSSLEILKEYAKIDNRIIIINKENQGVATARNDGIRMAKGEYITFLDSDDWFELNALELIYNKIKNTNTDILVYNITNVYDDKTSRSVRMDNIKTDVFSFIDAPKEFFYILTGTPGKVIKNENIILQKINLVKGEDTVFFWENCLRENVKIALLNKSLYNYRQHSQSAMNNIKIVNRAELYKAINSLLELDSFKKASTKNRAYILDRFAQSVCYELRFVPNNQNFSILYKKQIENFINLFDEYPKDTLKTLDFYKKMKKLWKKRKYRYIDLILKNLFSIKNSPSKQHKVITILGIKIKFKRKKH